MDGNVSREHATELEDTIWSHLPDLRPLRADQFGDYNYGSEVRHSDPLALTQLLITYHLLQAYSKDAPMAFARPIAAPKPAAIRARYAGGSGYGEVSAN